MLFSMTSMESAFTSTYHCVGRPYRHSQMWPWKISEVMPHLCSLRKVWSMWSFLSASWDSSYSKSSQPYILMHKQCKETETSLSLVRFSTLLQMSLKGPTTLEVHVQLWIPNLLQEADSEPYLWSSSFSSFLLDNTLKQTSASEGGDWGGLSATSAWGIHCPGDKWAVASLFSGASPAELEPLD
jgi:hypothetical protein